MTRGCRVKWVLSQNNWLRMIKFWKRARYWCSLWMQAKFYSQLLSFAFIIHGKFLSILRLNVRKDVLLLIIFDFFSMKSVTSSCQCCHHFRWPVCQNSSRKKLSFWRTALRNIHWMTLIWMTMVKLLSQVVFPAHMLISLRLIRHMWFTLPSDPATSTASSIATWWYSESNQAKSVRRVLMSPGNKASRLKVCKWSLSLSWYGKVWMRE